MLRSGQQVRIKSNAKSFIGHDFVSCMERHKGKIFTIRKPYFGMDNCYELVGDDNECYWHEKWLMPVGSSDEEFE